MASSPHCGVGDKCKDEDITPISFCPPPCPLIDRLCSQSWPRKGYQFTTHALRVLIPLPLVMIFSFLFWFLLYSDYSTLCCVITACGRESLYNPDGPGGIQCLCSSSADVNQNGDFMGSLNKKTSGAHLLYNGFSSPMVTLG